MKIKYEIHGQGRAVILLHAFPLDGKMWADNLEVLTRNGFQVIVPELEFNLGDKDALSETAASIGQIVDSLNIEKAIFGGLSMGGYVCFNLYRLRPELFAGLILCDTNSSADSGEKRNSRFELIEKLRQQGNQALVESMLPNLLAENTKLNNPAIFEKVKDWIISSDADKNIAALAAMADRKDHDYILKEINVPTKIIFGKEDKITDLKIAEKLQRGISKSELSIIPDAGHYSNIEQPELFNELVIEFVSKIHY